MLLLLAQYIEFGIEYLESSIKSVTNSMSLEYRNLTVVLYVVQGS